MWNAYLVLVYFVRLLSGFRQLRGHQRWLPILRQLFYRYRLQSMWDDCVLVAHSLARNLFPFRLFRCEEHYVVNQLYIDGVSTCPNQVTCPLFDLQARKNWLEEKHFQFPPVPHAHGRWSFEHLHPLQYRPTCCKRYFLEKIHVSMIFRKIIDLVIITVCPPNAWHCIFRHKTRS